MERTSLLFGCLLIGFIYLVYSTHSMSNTSTGMGQTHKTRACACRSGVRIGGVRNGCTSCNPAKNVILPHARSGVSEGFSSYNDYVMDTGLEPSVKESHNRFIDEIKSRTSGASAQTTFSHETVENPWVGLRRPAYDVDVSEDARVVPSSYKYQMSTNNTPKLF